MRNTLVGAASLLLLLTRPGVAQQIRGVVTDSAAGTPIAGAAMVLLNASGEVLARTITNQAGGYMLAPLSEPATLRVTRLGFRPRTIRLASPPPERLDVVLTRLPTLLQPVRVAAAPNCPRRSDRQAAFALLEQARAGLLTAQVARFSSPTTSMSRLNFRRWMRGTSDRADSMTVSLDSVGRAPGSYEAVKSARQFLRDGFVYDDGDTVHYLGPDAEVILDEAFTYGYCFHLRHASGAERANQLGLAFVPATRQRGRIDVDGTLWLDTLKRELRDLEFRYLGLPGRSDDAKPGGTLAFWTMPNGMVFIDRWSFRWPRLAAETTYATAGTFRIRDWIEAVEGGGEVARAAWDDSTGFAGSLGLLHGRAVDRAGNSVTNVVVRLRNTDYLTSPDADGYFEIGQLVPGPYIADIVDPAIAHLGITFPTLLRFTAQRDSVNDVRLLVPYTHEYVLSGCDGRSWPGPRREPGMLQVRVTMANKPVANARWEIRRKVRGDWEHVVERRRTGEDGVIYTCLVYEADDEVEVRVFEDGGKFHSYKLRIGSRSTLEVKLPPAPPRLPNRPRAERPRGCVRDTIGSPCLS